MKIRRRLDSLPLPLFCGGGEAESAPPSGFLFAIRKRVKLLPQDLVTFHTIILRILCKIFEKIGRPGAAPGPVIWGSNFRDDVNLTEWTRITSSMCFVVLFGSDYGHST